MPDDERKVADRQALIQNRKKLSRDWLADGFYPQWEKVYKNYKAEPDEKLDEDGKPDKDLTNLGSPLTFSASRRMVARVTAQTPQFQFRSAEAREPVQGSGAKVPVSELIGTTQMFQWDRAGMQRIQKKHVLQAVLLGWSPRLWYWASEIYPRRKKINIADAIQNPELLQQIEATYLEKGFFQRLIEMIMTRAQQTGMPPDMSPIMSVLANLQAKYGKGNLLPIEYFYKHYEGPKADFTMATDCFPEPHFQSLRTCNWFIVNQLRGWPWLQKMATEYPDELGTGIELLLRDYPYGTGRRFDAQSPADDQEMFKRLLRAIGRSADFTAEGDIYEEHEGQWLITEQHTRGPNSSIDYLDATSGRYLGRIKYPYDIAGRIALTDCVLIDDLVSGIGDSVARIMRGLHQVHSDQLGYRTDLVKNILRPLIGTRDMTFWDNPGLIKKMHGFRLVYMRGGPESMWQQPELQAVAAAQAGLAEDQSILHQYFMFSSENSMSTMASVDPSNTRTAAGVNYIANQTDIVTRDYNDAFLQSSLREDAEMMWLMNRSELTDGLDFEASQYNRNLLYDDTAWRENWVRSEPEHFQIDGEISVKPGSTLAEDDVIKQAEAEKMFGMAMNAPQLVNPQKARDNLLIAGGHRHDLPDWIPQPVPPAGPEIKVSMSANFKAEDMVPAEKEAWLQKAGIMEQPPPPDQGIPGGPGTPGGGPPGMNALPPGAPPGGPPGPGPMGPPQGAPPNGVPARG